ncbi:TIR domain-containing protein [Bradyrhizobium sp. th.b2]|uniref:TIR domain-containing protein n=1 Tax=Bradyrhizobium sp. th-b2 TaxID=172088 RepID=UPI00040BEDF7|nr:TIR domain-containing protein [Bradyrhizobium sp. th.b2]
MAKKSFLSFYYKDDSWRVSQIKNIGAVEEQPILSANAWEAIKDKGDDAIKEWIETNMRGRDCLIVLVGARTSGRRWVKHEIRRACERGMGVFGIYVHNLKDADGKQSTKGSDPFSGVTVNNVSISSYAKMYDPPFSTSTYVYEHISENISDWIDNAIKARK